jgi:hypothetical protein
MQIPQLTPHPIKSDIRRANLKLWQLSRLLGGSPGTATLSNMLNGVRPMSEEVESGLRNILDEIKQQPIATQ